PLLLFFFPDPAHTETYTLSLHDALPIFKDYISYHTQGNRSVSTTVDIVLAQFLDRYELDQELPADYLKISPKVKGSLIIESGRKDRKSTRLNSSHVKISYAVFCLKKKKQ